jgi:hypothetical protein
MKALLTIAAVLLVPTSNYARGPKPCEELKSEIASSSKGNPVLDIAWCGFGRNAIFLAAAGCDS